MNAFHFSLEKVLEWRRAELKMAESHYRRELAALADLDRRRMELESAGALAELQVRGWKPVTGLDLAALGTYRLRIRDGQTEIRKCRARKEEQVAERRNAMLEAQRRCRLLERLKERRAEEWRAAGEKEMAELASESFLARWAREGRPVNGSARSADPESAS